jgi:hypothetical protein
MNPVSVICSIFPEKWTRSLSLALHFNEMNRVSITCYPFLIKWTGSMSFALYFQWNELGLCSLLCFQWKSQAMNGSFDVHFQFISVPCLVFSIIWIWYVLSFPFSMKWTGPYNRLCNPFLLLCILNYMNWSQSSTLYSQWHDLGFRPLLLCILNGM